MDLRALRAAVDALRHDMRQRPGHNDGTEATTLDALSEFVANAAAKAGEIDGIKIQIGQLKRRLRRVEEDSAKSPTPPQLETSQRSSMVTQSSVTLPPPSPPPPPTTQRPPIASPPVIEPALAGWNAVNSVKRKSPEAEDYDPQTGAKRLKPVRGPPAQSYIENLTRSGQEPPRLAPIRTFHHPEDHEWHHPTLPAIRSAGYSSRRPGRPSKPPPENIGTPPWEREGWSGPEVDSKGRSRPVGAVPPSTSTLDRGRLVRRGSASGIRYMDQAAVAEKTRQKPVRNSEGVLNR